MTHERPPAVAFGPFRFEPGNGLWRDGQEIALPPRALGILDALIAQPGEVVSKQRLIDAVWKDAFVTDASLLEAIRVLRDALADDRHKPTYIQTVHRRGYRFIAPVASASARSVVSGELRRDRADQPPLKLRRSAEALAKAEAATGRSGGPDAPSPMLPLLAASLAAAVAMIGIAIVFALFGQRPSEVAADDALHDRLAGQHVDRSVARLDCGLGRRHAHGLCRAQQRPAAPVPPHDRSRRAARHRRIRRRLRSLPVAGRGMGRVLRARQPEEAAHRRRNAGGDLCRACRERRGLVGRRHDRLRRRARRRPGARVGRWRRAGRAHGAGSRLTRGRVRLARHPA